MQIYENPQGNLVLELPRMLGSRAKAVSVVSEFPDFLDDKIIEVIATDSVGAHHSFVDEFCTQILIYRNAKRMIFVDPPKMMQQSISFYGIVREYDDRISFEFREK
jgi:hypothetical protein